MKKTNKVLGIIALLAVIGFSAVQFTACVSDNGNNDDKLLHDAIEIEVGGDWVDGNLTDAEQWFYFRANSSPSLIHFEPDTLIAANIQLYEYNDKKMDGGFLLGPVAYSVDVKSGMRYYIQITPLPATFDKAQSGTYKLAVTGSADIPPAIAIPTADAEEITVTYEGHGEPLATEIDQFGQKWYKFTSVLKEDPYNTGDFYPQFIHFIPDTIGLLDYVTARLYDADGKAVSNWETITSWEFAGFKVANNKEYYLRLSAGLFFKGPFKLIVSKNVYSTQYRSYVSQETWLHSEETINTMGEEIWLEREWGNPAGDDVKVFIHYKPGTLTGGVFIDMFDAKGKAVGDVSSIFSTTTGKSFIAKTLPRNDRPYYIRVRGNTSSTEGEDGEGAAGYTGKFNIAVSTGFITTNNVTSNDDIKATPTPLTVASTWTNGNITTAGDEQWYKFTATAATHYIHYDKTSALGAAYVSILDGTGTYVANSKFLGGSYGDPNFSQAVTSGNTYYIKVTAFSSDKTGAYKIAVSTTATTPTN